MAELRTGDFKIRGEGRFDLVASLSVWVEYGRGDAKLDGGAVLAASEVLVRAYRSALPESVGEGDRVELSTGERLELVARWPQGQWAVCKCRRVS